MRYLMTFKVGIALTASWLALGAARGLAADVNSIKTLNERLLEAAQGGHLDEVKVLLHDGAKVNARNDSFKTPLIVAASTGNVGIVQALLKAGADVNAKAGVNGVTALMYAALRGNIPLVRILLDAKAQLNLKDNVGRTALHFAAHDGKIEVMEMLLAAGADPLAEDSHFLGTPLHHAAVGGHAEAVRCLLRHGCPVGLHDEDGAAPLHLAVIGHSNAVDVIQALLDAGANINETDASDGETPLMWAAQSEHIGSLKFLVQSHADLNKTDNLGWTALMKARVSGQDEAVKILEQAGGEEHTNLSYAAAVGDLATVRSLLTETGTNRPSRAELGGALGIAAQNYNDAVVKELLAQGANPNARLYDDWTPLLFACKGDVGIARQLLAAGADVNLSRNLNGDSPLMYAAASLPSEFLEELISKGARVNETTKEGDTPAGWAALGGKLENLKVLVKHGAEINIHIGTPDGYVGWPFIKAIQRGDVAFVDFLLAHGADINTQGSYGKTPLLYAVENNKVEIVKLLIVRGVNVFTRADYDVNNTALKLAENTGKTEIAALLHIMESKNRDSGDTGRWGAKLKHAFSESMRAQIDNHTSDNTALLALTKEITAAKDASPAMKADARYLAAMADLETLKASGPVSNTVVRAAVEADIRELGKNHPADVRTSLVQQQLEALLGSRAETPLDLKFQAVDGADIDLAKLRGKVVLVDFWATWCGPCRMEIPKVVATYNELHKDGFEIIGISLDESRERLTNFTKQAGMGWPQYFDGKSWENVISSRYGIQSIPTMWLVDKKGFVRPIEVHGESLAAQAKTLLAE
jgi:ankyrin repeat protein/thiol-disulfide isomerase/thioredoxin